MSDGIVRPFSGETVEDLLRRSNTPLTTAAIASRFGWEVTAARRTLKKLAAAGQVVQARKSFHGIGGGNMLGWTLPSDEQENRK